MIARLLVALIAVAVLAWVGVLLRDYELGYQAGVRAFSPNVSRGERQRDLEHLKQAQLLDPDSYWRVSRASSYLFLGRPQRSAALTQAVLRDEPQNISAWSVLARATKRSDPRRAAQALAEIRRLDPLISPQFAR